MNSKRIQRDIFDDMEIYSVHIRNVFMRYIRGNDNVVVIVELDTESEARTVLAGWYKLKQKNSRFFVKESLSFEERQRRKEARLNGQRLSSGRQRSQGTERLGEGGYSPEDIHKAIMVMQSLNGAGNGRSNRAPPTWGAAARNGRQYGSSQH